MCGDSISELQTLLIPGAGTHIHTLNQGRVVIAIDNLAS